MKHKHLTVKVTKEAHPHIEMIVAKAANMDLVLFFKAEGGNWRISTLAYMAINDKHDYFLCLPQHKEACLHWLNDGETEILDGKGFYPFSSRVINGDWSEGHVFMSKSDTLRIKPKKEKRWLMVQSMSGVCTDHFSTPERAKQCVCETDKRWQLIEIEVEV